MEVHRKSIKGKSVEANFGFISFGCFVVFLGYLVVLCRFGHSTVSRHFETLCKRKIATPDYHSKRLDYDINSLRIF